MAAEHMELHATPLPKLSPDEKAAPSWIRKCQALAGLVGDTGPVRSAPLALWQRQQQGATGVAAGVLRLGHFFLRQHLPVSQELPWVHLMYCMAIHAGM